MLSAFAGALPLSVAAGRIGGARVEARPDGGVALYDITCRRMTHV
jgi:hypothetical protein